MTKLAPEWVRTSDPVIRSPARYRWTTAPAIDLVEKLHLQFCKSILYVNKSTPTCMVLGDLGRRRVEHLVDGRMLTY